MKASARQPAVVAELGRPETPEETAARKAQDSRNHRTRQTVNNLVFSLLATLGVVLIIVLLVPRADGPVTRNVDYAQLAAAGQGSEPDPLVSPVLPASWRANAAELRTGTPDGVDSWYIGLITPDQQYIGITQGFHANPGWLAAQVHGSDPNGSVSIDSVAWTRYDNRASGGEHGNVEYALTTASGASSYVIFGTASEEQFRTVARAIAGAIEANEPQQTQ